MKKTICYLLLLCTSFSLSADNWIQKANFGGPSTNSAVGFSINGKGYVGTGSPTFSAGKTFWEYDPITDSWTQKADFPGEAREDATGFSIGDKGYIGLGRVDDCCYPDDFWLYDPTSNSWTEKGIFPGGGRANSFTFTSGAKAYVGGGSKNVGYKDDFWEYDYALDLWTQKADYGGGKVAGSVAFTIDGKAYVGLGRNNTLDYLKDFWEYNFLSDTWIQKQDFIGGERSRSIGMSIANVGFIGLGETQDTIFSDFWQYDVSNDDWIKKADYPGDPAGRAVGFSIGTKGFVGTGGTSGKQWWQYVPDCIAPSGLKEFNITSSKATLIWNAVGVDVNYKVRYKVSGTNSWTIAGATDTLRKISGLLPGTTYQWQVKTICGIDPIVSSTWSTKESFTTSLKLSAEQELNSIEVYPNPFTASSTISFNLEEDSYVKVDVFGLSGITTIKTLVNQYIDAGDHTIELNRNQLQAGVYFLRIAINEKSSILKIVVL